MKYVSRFERLAGSSDFAVVGRERNDNMDNKNPTRLLVAELPKQLHLH